MAEEEVEEAPAPGSIPARLDQPRLVLPEPERAPERVPEPPERWKKIQNDLILFEPLILQTSTKMVPYLIPCIRDTIE